MQDLKLPIHPTKRHPLTGQPLQAIWVRPDGRVMWPMIGGAPAEGEGAGEGAGAGGAGGDGAGQGSGTARTNATDAQGNDLGFPKDTPVNEMSDKEAAAYWRNNSRKHEGLWKGIAGERKLEDVKKDLEDLAEIRKAEQTPAEQALTESFDKGKAAGLAAARNETATAVFRGALEAAEMSADDIDELVSNFNVANYVTDDGVDTTKITNFAKKFTPAGTGGQQRKRDFGGGQRQEVNTSRGTGGQAALERRYGKSTRSGA